MTYKNNSEWNESNEIKCFIIFKQLEKEMFPRNRQMELCEEMAKETKLEKGNIIAKVSNYKSIAGINNPSNASKNTKRIYATYKYHDIDELKKFLKKL